MSAQHSPSVTFAAQRGTSLLSFRPAARRWTERLARFGMFVRGTLFLLLGAAAARVALQPAEPIGQQNALQLIARQPAGGLLLLVVAVGLGGYALWGVVRAVFDPQRRGRGPKALLRRLGYFTSGLGYLALLFVASSFATGRLGLVTSYDRAIDPLPDPLRLFAVVVVGLSWILGSGLGQVVLGATGEFMRDLETDRMASTTRRWTRALGQIGLIARGLVFTVIGGLLIGSAGQDRPTVDIGIDHALTWILHEPFGRLLLGAAGAGLMAFGTYSVLCGRWLRISRAPQPAAAPPPFPASLL